MVVGLGNPGREYEATRHNIGFAIVDEVAKRLAIDRWKRKDGALQAHDAPRRLVLIKPQTFMNNSGAPVRLIASWYRTPPQSILAAYDDMDIPFGTLRLRPFGGHAGHNGMRSMIATLGDGFPRLRVGLGRPQEESVDHVLSPFTVEESAAVPKIVSAAADGVECWLNEGLESAMQFVNTWTL